MIELLLDGLLYAATAAVVSLSGREFKFYNLAAGAWIVLGGWLSAFLMGSWMHAPAPVHPWCFFLFLAPALAQVTSPLFLREKLRENPLVYLLVSLGIALIVTTLGTTFLLRMSSATIPIDRRGISFTVLVVAAVVVLTWYLMQSSRWAKTVLEFRHATSRPLLWQRLTWVLLVELVLLIVLGGVGYHVHKGVFSSAEYRTVIPLLAVMATRSNYISASILSFSVVAVSHLIEMTGQGLAGYSAPIAIASLAILVLIKNWPVSAILRARKTESLPDRKLEGNIWSDQNVFGFVVLSVLFAGFALALGLSSEVLHHTLFMTSLVALSWIAHRYLGLLSIAWPALATLFIYATLIVRPTFWTLSILFVFTSLAWATYLWCLRVLKIEPALLMDLSLVVCLHQIVKKAAPISGDESVRIFNLTKEFNLPIFVPIVIPVSIVAGCLAMAYFSDRQRQLRASALSMSNLTMGLFHGAPVASIFMRVATVLAGLAALAVVGYHVSQPGITPSGLAVETGLIILLFSNLAERWGPAPTFIALFVFYAVLASIMAKHGIMLRGVVGVALIVLAFAPRVLRYWKW